MLVQKENRIVLHLKQTQGIYIYGKSFIFIDALFIIINLVNFEPLQWNFTLWLVMCAT